MNSHLRQKILNKLLNLYEEQSNYSLRPGELELSHNGLLDLSDTDAVLQMIDRRVAPLSKVWDDVRVGVERARRDTDAKDAVQAEVALKEGKNCLQKLLDRSKVEGATAADDEEKGKKKKMGKKRAEELKEILDLADQAVLHCPADQADALAAMYAFRADALEHAGQLEAALVNTERALSLVNPTQMLIVLKKVRLLLAIEDAQAPSKKVAAKYAQEMSLLEPALGQQTADEQQVSTEMKRQWATLLDKLEAICLLEDKGKSDADCDTTEAKVDRQTKPSRYQLKEAVEGSLSRGRSLIASEDLPSGATVLVESVHSLAFLPSQRLRKCALCSRPVDRTFRPCGGCLSAVYCGDQCASEHAAAGGHRTECGLLKLLTGLVTTKKAKDISDGLKTLHVYRQFVSTGAEALLAGGEDKDLVLLQHSSPQQQQQQQKLDRVEVSPDLVCALQCAMIFLIASGYEYEQISTEQLVALVQMALLDARRVSMNALTWSEVDQERGEKVVVGTVLALSSSMLNHSCLPNAEWTPLFADDSDEGSLMKVKLSTSKRVSAGDELTINYLAHLPPLASFAAVRRRLQRQYGFTCSCSRCLEMLAQGSDVGQLPLPLQCARCPGPVLLLGDDEEGEAGLPWLLFSEEAIAAGTGHCLLCCSPLPGAREQAKKAERARQALHLIARLFDAVAADEAKRHYYLAKMVETLEVVVTSLYRKSLLLLEDIYAVCKVLHRERQFEQLVLFYGRVIDKLLPLDGPKLLALGKTGELNTAGTRFTDVFDVNIEHLLFWADGVFGGCTKKEKSLPAVVMDSDASSAEEDGEEKEEDDFWKILTGFRFAYRLEKALQLVIAEKQRRLLPPDLEKFQDFASSFLKDELLLLKALALEKAAHIQ